MITRETNMKANLAIGLAALFPFSFLSAENAGEETWYCAEGKAVKTVKQSLRAVAGERSSGNDWEPRWVLRERERVTKRLPFWDFGYRYGRAGIHGARMYSSVVRFYLRGQLRGGVRGCLHDGNARMKGSALCAQPRLIFRIAR